MSENSKTLADEDHEKAIEVKVGTTLLYPATFGTSAYQWRAPSVTGSAVKFDGYDMKRSECSSGGPAIPGATSKGAFKFVATQVGTSKIELSQGYMSRDESDLVLSVTVHVV